MGLPEPSCHDHGWRSNHGGAFEQLWQLFAEIVGRHGPDPGLYVALKAFWDSRADVGQQEGAAVHRRFRECRAIHGRKSVRLVVEDPNHRFWNVERCGRRHEGRSNM